MFYSFRVSLSLWQGNCTNCKLQLITLSAYKPPPPPHPVIDHLPVNKKTLPTGYSYCKLPGYKPPSKCIDQKCVCVFACVLPTGRSFLIVLVLRHASWPLHKGCLASFTLSSIPTQVRPGGPSILPLITNGTRSPCHRVHVLTKAEIRSDQNLRTTSRSHTVHHKQHIKA